MFDTKGDLLGGNGLAFDWNILRDYDREKPFFLSGGISNDNIDQLLALAAGIPIHGIDVNSRYETAPGLKDVEEIEKLIGKIRVKEAEELEV